MRNLPENVTIVGAGTQGSMLAFRSAAFGRNVCLYDLSQEQLSEAMSKIKGWFGDWVDTGQLSPDIAAQAYRNMRATTNLENALENCDIMIENVPEILTLKQSVWAQLDQTAPLDTLLTTNSSSLKASDIGASVARKDKTFNINFMTPTTDDLVEVMWNQFTSEETKAAALAFLTAQNNVPIITKKEIKGFSLNRVWRAIKKESLKLWAGGYITPEDFDRAWMLEWGTPHGPFGLMDKVGLDIVEQIELTYYEESQDPDDMPPAALREMIDKGLLGEKSGKGFYEYPHPAYRQPGWLKKEQKESNEA